MEPIPLPSDTHFRQPTLDKSEKYALKEYSLRELINPFPKQEEFLQAIDKYKYVLYGGAKHGGKSYILRWALIRQLLKWTVLGHKNVRAGLFCEDYPTLQDRQITKIKAEFPLWLGTLSDSRTEGLAFVLRPKYGGGIIALRNLDDISKYASSEFAICAIDQVEKNLRKVFDELRSIIRWPGIENTKFIATSNPGGIGHDWVKKLWIDRNISEEDPDAGEIHFVRSLPSDNPYTTKEYLAELGRLPEKLRKAYLEGIWDIFEGQYFTEWNPSKHVVEPFEIPPDWKKFRSYDHGREAPACCKWYAVDFDGRVFVYREFYQSGLDVDQIAEQILELSGKEEYVFSVADPSIFHRLGFVDRYGGQTIAESFARQGVAWYPASNRRIDGWNLLHEYLRFDENKEPRIKYFKTCFNSIRTLPALIHDDKRPEDFDTRGEDHAGDTDRYLLLTLHERKSSKPANSEEENFKRMMKLHKSSFNAYYYA